MDGIVYVRADAETCFERVGKRARTGESAIELEYLTRCGEYHDAWLQCSSVEFDCPVLLIDANPREFQLVDERQISEQETWAHLAVCGEEIYVRDLRGISAFRWK